MNGSGSSIGILDVLTIIFVVLKLCNVIDWSWWWVLSPALIGIALGIIMLIIYIALK